MRGLPLSSGPPPRYQSGSSNRGRPGVSQHARKRLKSLFHLGAMAAIRAKGELQDYYQRKVKEGKIGSPKRQNAAGPPGGLERRS